jgi:hypothetical protein
MTTQEKIDRAKKYAEFRERFESLHSGLSSALFDELTSREEGRLLTLICSAHAAGDEQEKIALDAEVGRIVRNTIEHIVRREKDADEPEEMYGNHAYDAIAKDRASKY